MQAKSTPDVATVKVDQNAGDRRRPRRAVSMRGYLIRDGEARATLIGVPQRGETRPASKRTLGPFAATFAATEDRRCRRHRLRRTLSSKCSHWR